MNKKIVLISIANVLIILISISLIAYSKFTTEVKGNVVAQIANAVELTLSNDTFTLEGMKPGDTKEYNFTVLNYDQSGKPTQVDMAYYFQVNTYGVLPLQFEIRKVETSADMANNQEEILGDNILINNISTNEFITRTETRTRL